MKQPRLYFVVQTSLNRTNMIMLDKPTTNRILVVDDEQLVAIVVARSLKALGEQFVVETVFNATEALQKISENQYLVILTDYQMPELTGFELIEQARQIDPQIGVIVMTAFGTSTLRREAMRLGINGFIDKPFDIQELRALVSQVINQRKFTA